MVVEGDANIYKELNRNTKGSNKNSSKFATRNNSIAFVQGGKTMDTTNKRAFGNRSQSVTKSNFASTSKTNQDSMLFTKDLGLNKYVVNTLA
jgi:hypothetical protein